ncbi:hypothetical protein F7725_015995 [Dissostichus mawsoni]|uniref:Uncharacterized protein n=1 Tax=Dissostichus mawsoni TaxID=36200 RepID=A0A7J5Y5N4_DISMA|nr:hypothetical protein F7725_015995 [Dissostichus mawsoni]
MTGQTVGSVAQELSAPSPLAVKGPESRPRGRAASFTDEAVSILTSRGGHWPKPSWITHFPSITKRALPRQKLEKAVAAMKITPTLHAANESSSLTIGKMTAIGTRGKKQRGSQTVQREAANQ